MFTFTVGSYFLTVNQQLWDKTLCYKTECEESYRFLRERDRSVGEAGSCIHVREKIRLRLYPYSYLPVPLRTGLQPLWLKSPPIHLRQPFTTLIRHQTLKVLMKEDATGQFQHGVVSYGDFSCSTWAMMKIV